MLLALAHAAGGPGDLPVPLPVVLVAVAAVVGGAVPLARRRRPSGVPGDAVQQAAAAPPEGDTAASPTREPVETLVGTHLIVAAVGGVAMTALLALLAFGPDRPEQNPAALMLYVVGFGIVVPLSALGVSLWRLGQPLAWPALAIGSTEADAKPHLGVVPGALALGAFFWLELVLRPNPATVLVVVVGLAVAVLIGVLRCGPGWIHRADGFGVTADLFAQVRRPGPPTLVEQPGTAAVIGVLIGAQVFDLVAETPGWARWQFGFGPSLRLVVATAALATACAAVALLVRLVAARPGLRRALAPTALAWTLPHVLGLVLIDGQVLYHMSRRMLDPAHLPLLRDEPLPAALVGVVSLLAFVGLHALALVRAEGAVGDLTRKRADAALFPLRAFVITSAVAGVWMLAVLPPD